MKKRVYIETTIVSYLTAKPTRDLIIAAHQEITREWWAQYRSQFDVVVSQLVIDEAGDGDSSAAAKRLDVLKGLSVVSVSLRATSLAKDFVSEGLIPEKAVIDALHLAVGVVHGVDVLLTWNCRHLANATMLGDIGQYVRSRGHEMPIVCTPEELMGEDGYRNEG